MSEFLKLGELKPEEQAEIILFKWLKKGEFIKEIYFNRKNKINAPLFTTCGVNQKPDLLIKFNLGYVDEYIAVEVKSIKKSRDIYDANKILVYYENFFNGSTKYYVDSKEIKINHFAIATDNSIKGHLFHEKIEKVIIDNFEESADEWRKINSKLKLIPRFEFQDTYRFIRSLWANWRLLRKKLKLIPGIKAPSIGILISEPKGIQNPHLFTMIYVDWLNKKHSWKQRFWRL